MEQRKLAISRDAGHCRICGSSRLLETHHVEPRSAFGPKRMADKHDKTNLLTVCGGPDGCHTMLTGKLFKAQATTDKGTDGPVRIEKYDDSEGGYVVWKRAA